MKKSNFNKKIFWCTIIPALLVNIVPIYFLRDKARISNFSFSSIMLLVFALIYGLLAYVSKDARCFIIQKYYHHRRFWKYIRPTAEDMREFWRNATIYFLPIPFYLPIIFFSTTHLHFLWCLLLLSLPQLVFFGIDVRETLRDVKEEKRRQEQLEKERVEQEKREALGRWK